MEQEYRGFLSELGGKGNYHPCTTRHSFPLLQSRECTQLKVPEFIHHRAIAFWVNSEMNTEGNLNEIGTVNVENGEKE